MFSVSHEKINLVPSISPSICRRSVAFSDLHLFSFPLTTSPLNYSKSHVSILQNENYAFLILVWCFLKQIVTLLLVLSKGVSCSEKSGKQDCHSSIIPLKLHTCKFCTKKILFPECMLQLSFKLQSSCRNWFLLWIMPGKDAHCSNQFCAPSEGKTHSVCKKVLAGKLNVKPQFN